MDEELMLNGEWEFQDRDLDADPLSEAWLLTNFNTDWMIMKVPGDIHEGLLKAGKIQEPLVGLNSYECRWTEERAWWFRKAFMGEPDWKEADAIELELAGLDSNADVFINGFRIGSHRNAFYPFLLNLKPWLLLEKNVLLVRLTVGVETVSTADLEMLGELRDTLEEKRGRPERGDPRRIFVRKPQYSFGWDWSPRLPTTGITGDVRLRIMKDACIRHVSLWPKKDVAGEVVVTAMVEVEHFHPYKTLLGEVSVKLTEPCGGCFHSRRSILVHSGTNFVELSIPIRDPKLWWPNGLGEQPLYQVEVELDLGKSCVKYPLFDYGLRFVELDTQDGFAIVINGKRVFCKGANWVPADALYARVENAKYELLIHEAQRANFNMLRVWGGGLYERDAFYQACDRHGIMIWHDFMFSCAPYPDHLEWFRREVELEAEYQTKRLQHHACIVLWSGCNENNWGFEEWWHESTYAGAWIYNYLLPTIVARNCPEIPYWNGSPYGGDHPNCYEVGDHHHWDECMMNPSMEKRITPEEYDQCNALFITEFGYIGACCEETTRDYIDNLPLDRSSEVWRHHTNTFEQDTVIAGIRKHYKNSDVIDLEEYLLYSGLCQGLMYGYAFDSMRSHSNCFGSLVWMYNDCWGEVGWSIIDYYLRRKPSWYFVRRALEPIRLILRKGKDGIRVVVANDEPETVSMELEYGYVSLDGKTMDLDRRQVEIPALTRGEVFSFPLGGHDPLSGLWIVRACANPAISPGVFRAADYRQLRIMDPGISLSLKNEGGNRYTARVGAQAYAHAVVFKLPDHAILSDNYFDLLPGETRVIGITTLMPLNASEIVVTCLNSTKSTRLE